MVDHKKGGNNVSSPLLWKSKKLRRVFRSAMAAETLIQDEVTETCKFIK